jgi:hypothetical protein
MYLWAHCGVGYVNLKALFIKGHSKFLTRYHGYGVKHIPDEKHAPNSLSFIEVKIVTVTVLSRANRKPLKAVILKFFFFYQLCLQFLELN